MNKDVNSELFKILYLRAKPYLMSLLMIVVSVILVFVAIIPQFGDLISTLSQRNEALSKLQIVKNNFTILKNTDNSLLDSQLSLALKALPQTKDFEGILNIISKSAASSGVTMGSYEFKVGDLSKTDKIEAGQFPHLSVSIIINDGAVGASRFMKQLATSLPLSEVKSIDTNGNFSNLTLLFYYKSLPSLKFPADVAIPVLNTRQKQTLEQISSWDKSSESNFPVIDFSSSSASNSATNSAF